MNIRLKLTLGIGLLFLFIIGLSLISMVKFNNLSNDSGNILKDNYKSLRYSREMLASLEDLQSNPDTWNKFKAALNSQIANITEEGEQEATDNLKNHVQQLERSTADSILPATIRKDIYSILHLNMDAIARKSTIAERTASNAMMWLTGAATLSFIISLLLLLNLPGNIANPIQELTRSIEAIAAQHYSKRVHFKSNSEFGKLSDSFNVMAEKLEEYHNSKMAELLMEKKRIDTLINNMRDPILGLDEQNKILFINNEALLTTGLRREQVIGKSVQDIAVHNDLVRTIIKDLIPAHNTPAVVSSHEALKIFADGKESYFEKEIVKITIHPTGETTRRDIGHVIILKNVTTFKELDSAKTNFIAMVSHELKTPLSAIKMSVQLLMNPVTGVVNEDQEQLLESIDDDSNRLLKITGELLNMTQVESGNIQLNIMKTDPEDIVNYAIEAVSFPAERKGVKIVKQTQGIAPQINADADKTAWVLVNFLTNAIRYSNPGSTIFVSIEMVGDKVKVTVTDSGKGIEEMYLEKIFSRYFQVPGSAKTGTGLGLAISKEFIEAQQGTIGVESRVGEGSSFYFLI
jgi:two-component system, NtrC family, sensor histidine kinase KinB